MISLDTQTRAAYDAANLAADRAQAVLDEITDPVTVKVYNGSGTLMGSGTMAAPWATRSGGTLTIGEVTSFNVLLTGTPSAASWYLRFESGTTVIKWVRGSFGPNGNFTWSLPTWTAEQKGTIGAVTLVAADSGLVFGWDIPDLAGVDYTFNTPTSGSNTEGQVATYDVSQFLTIPPGVTPEFSITSAPVSGLSINSTTGVISKTVDVVEGNYDIDVEAWDGQPDVSAAEADWLYRSGQNPQNPQPGVLWYHAFTDVNEVNRYRWYNTGGTGCQPDYDTYDSVTHLPNDGPNGVGGAVRVWHKGGVESTAGGGWVRHFAPQRAWRTLQDDPGCRIYIPNGALPEPRAFNPVQGVDSSFEWSKDYGCYGPADAEAISPRGQPYHGREFWLSLRGRLSSLRQQGFGAGTKLVYLSTANGSVQEFNILQYVDNEGGINESYTGSTSTYEDGTPGYLRVPQFGSHTDPTAQYQTESPYASCSWYNSAACWKWPFDEWVTWVWHLKLNEDGVFPGKIDGWKTPGTSTLEFGVWLPNRGMTDWQWLFRSNNWRYIWGFNSSDPEAFSILSLTSYVQQTQPVGWYCDWSHVIFSTQAIPAPNY